MRFFVIGDVHGCYSTFHAMLEKHWDREHEALIQVGDLIDRGKNVRQVVGLARSLKEALPEQTVFLKGNHEFEMQKHVFEAPNANWLRQGGAETLGQYKEAGEDFSSDAQWLSALPLYYENDFLHVSHAGIAELAEDPLIENSAYGILWNRSPLKNIGKLQIIGHTPREKPAYDAASHSWNIDTGAVYSRYLTGVKIDETGKVTEFVKEETHEQDL